MFKNLSRLKQGPNILTILYNLWNDQHINLKNSLYKIHLFFFLMRITFLTKLRNFKYKALQSAPKSSNYTSYMYFSDFFPKKPHKYN